MKLVIVLTLAAFAFLANAQDESALSPLEPFTQDDLSLIVANVQRPNGMTFFDGHIYVVCNGDWTIYRINAETEETITYVYGVKDGNSFLVEGHGCRPGYLCARSGKQRALAARPKP